MQYWLEGRQQCSIGRRECQKYSIGWKEGNNAALVERKATMHFWLEGRQQPSICWKEATLQHWLEGRQQCSIGWNKGSNAVLV